jgi:hypothetical protein
MENIMPRIPVEDRKRIAALLATVDRQEAREKENKKKSDEVFRRIDAETAERIRTSPDMDADTRIAQTRRLASKGTYVFPKQRERAEAEQELGIVAVNQGDGTRRLQDLRKPGKPGLMTPQEIVDAGSRLDRYHQRMKDINKGTTPRTTPKPSTDPATERQLKVASAWAEQGKTPEEKRQRRRTVEKMAKNKFGRATTVSENINRELVDQYKSILQENILRTIVQGAKAGAKSVYKWLTGNKGMVPRVTDPVARGIGRVVKASPRTTVKVQKALRGTVRGAGPAAVVAGVVGTSNYFQGGRQSDAESIGIDDSDRLSYPSMGDMESSGSGRSGRSRGSRRYEANIDVIKNLADLNYEPEIEQLAALHSSGKGVNYRNRTVGIQRSLAYNLARRIGDKEAMSALKAPENKIMPVERRGKSNITIGSGVGGKPILVGGSYVDPNSPAGRIAAEKAKTPEAIKAEVKRVADERTERFRREAEAMANLEASKERRRGGGRVNQSPSPGAGQVSVPVLPTPSTGPEPSNQGRKTPGPPKENIPQR